LEYIQTLVRKISDVIEEDYGFDLSLQELAEEYKLDKKAREQFGLNPNPRVSIEVCPDCGGTLFYLISYFIDEGFDHVWICARCGCKVGGILDESLKPEKILED